MLMSRRGVLGGLASMLSAPAIVHAGNLMPIKALPVETPPNIIPVDPDIIVVDIDWPYPDLLHAVISDGDNKEFCFLRRVDKLTLKRVAAGDLKPNSTYFFRVHTDPPSA